MVGRTDSAGTAAGADYAGAVDKKTGADYTEAADRAAAAAGYTEAADRTAAAAGYTGAADRTAGVAGYTGAADRAAGSLPLEKQPPSGGTVPSFSLRRLPQWQQ